MQLYGYNTSDAAELWELVPANLPIPSGTPLFPGDSMTSPSGRFELSMQTDGNLVLYALGAGGSSRALWSSGTNGKTVVEAVMQSDGNLVVYGPNKAGGFLNPLWASNTSGNPGATLAIGNDGSLVIEPAGGGNPIRVISAALPSSNQTLLVGDSITSPNGQYELTLQSDGNLVLYALGAEGPKAALWSSGTKGKAAVEAVMQDDGHLWIYGANNSNGSSNFLWVSSTLGYPGATLALWNDGSLVIERPGVGVQIFLSQGLPPGNLTLFPGDSISSPNEQYELTLQTNGNLVLYQLGANGTNTTLWSSHTAGQAAVEAVMQTDGNLVVYGANNADGSWNRLWSSATNGNPGATLAVEDDGELVISLPGGGPALWAYGALPTGILTLFVGDSLTSLDGRYELTLQTDGNLVVDRLLGGNMVTATVWASGTAGKAALEAVMQADGNLVIYGANNPSGSRNVLWASHTNGNPGATLALQGNGSLVISPAAGGTPLWQTTALPQGNLVLYPGDRLTASNGQYLLSLQTDGNLVDYQLFSDGSTQALWASGTYGQAAIEAVMQIDGNFVIYGADHPNGSINQIWASDTSGNPGATLSLGNDGSLAILPAAGGNPIWKFRRSPRAS